MNNKVVLITGASRGIGRATAIYFAGKGFDVAINYNNNYDAAKEVNEIIKDKYKVETLLVKADISNKEQVKEMVDKIISKFGKIDVLVNNAGIDISNCFEKKDVEDWKKTIEVNLIGTFLVSKYVSKYMLDNKYGKIVNVSSNNGMDSCSPFSMDYDASKAGVISLTRNLAIQLQPYVNVNAVAPGWVNTDMNKDLDKEFIEEQKERIYIKRIAEPIEIAKVIYFLASDDASYINSEVIKVDGGY